MYETFFGLTERPFSKTPDPRFLYESAQHREALARLEYACEEGEIVLLTGEIGAGKTLLSRALLDRLTGRFEAALLINPRMTPREFLAAVCERMGIEPAHTRNAMIEAVHDHLYRRHGEGKKVVLMLDEAQLIPGRGVFDEIRLLTNFQLDDAPLLSVVLIGQSELRKRLALPAYRPLAQRVGMRYHLLPFDRAETGLYVEHRCRTAGARERMFEEGALDAIHEGAGGVPRLINTLAHAALLAAYGAERRMVSADDAQDAVEDFVHHGRPPAREPRDKSSNVADFMPKERPKENHG